MSGKTRIEWADAVWNPVTGCSPISAGCQNCYAERMSKRLAGRCGYPAAAGEPFRVTMHPERMDEPLRWRKHRMVFVCSMGDLFHEDVPDEYLEKIWDVMEEAKQHVFLVLTKRPLRAMDFVCHWIDMSSDDSVGLRWTPAQNIWIGVSVENQQAADERIPLLLEIPAAKRFISCEPLLGPVDLELWGEFEHPDNEGYGVEAIKCLDWVIAGGETGPGARPMHPDWVRSLRDQCETAHVPFFFKSWGEWGSDPYPHSGMKPYPSVMLDGEVRFRCGKQKAGRLLDGREWDEMPERSGC